jgi:hypothetical protein
MFQEKFILVAATPRYATGLKNLRGKHKFPDAITKE